jgi:16S rRNA U516 pseudouridylate synthase RsuA-like enzyme
MIEAVGNEVAALRRVRFGGLPLGALPEGRARRLRSAEIERLWKDSRP